MQDIWNNETVLSFIDEYRRHPVLWKDPKTKHTEAEKKEAWESLESRLGINVEELKRKWGTIMSVYRKEHHKVARRSGPHEQFTPKWYCFDKLNEFLPFPKKIAKRKIPRHHKPDPDLEEVDQQEEEFEVDEFQDASLQPEECVPTAPQYPDLRRPDDCDAFGAYLAEVLRKFDKRTRAGIKKEIAHIIFMAETNEF